MTSSDAEKSKWKSLRTTPRKLTPDELHQRAVFRRDRQRQSDKVRLDMMKAASEGDRDRRAKSGASLTVAYRRGVQKNAEIGINPIYLNGSFERRFHAVADWKKTAKAWDRRHP